MMRYRYTYFFLAVLFFIKLLLLPGCSRKPGIIHEIKAEKSPYVQLLGRENSCALVRTRMADVVIEPVDNKSWEKLLGHERFTGKDVNVRHRHPRLYFFKLVIRNNTATPVTLERLYIKTGEEELDSLSLKEVKARCSSPAYAAFNFKALLAQYRLLTDRVCMDKIDFKRDIIITRYTFIPPGDTVFRLAAFPWIPVQYRDVILSMELGNGDHKKIIDFKMDRIEYRTRGSHYRLNAGETQQ